MVKGVIGMRSYRRKKCPIEICLNYILFCLAFRFGNYLRLLFFPLFPPKHCLLLHHKVLQYLILFQPPPYQLFFKDSQPSPTADQFCDFVLCSAVRICSPSLSNFQFQCLSFSCIQQTILPASSTPKKSDH